MVTLHWMIPADENINPILFSFSKRAASEAALSLVEGIYR
jgi:hypothetical protein